MTVTMKEPTIRDLELLEAEMEASDRAREIAVEAYAWQDRAVCKGANPDLFFPERGSSTKVAKAMCKGSPIDGHDPCPVRRDCLLFAIHTGEKFGIWGGMSERERRRLRIRAAAEGLTIDQMIDRLI
jgi:WhiB family redox-sensing transcriptional regulator